MLGNKSFQQAVLAIVFGFCAALLVQGYRQIIGRANEDINGAGGLNALYGDRDPILEPPPKTH